MGLDVHKGNHGRDPRPRRKERQDGAAGSRSSGMESMRKMLEALHRRGAKLHFADESIRDLCRARFDAKQDERHGRQRLKSLLLRDGLESASRRS